MSEKYNCVVSGAQGYVGKELMALIKHHPYLQLAGIHTKEQHAPALLHKFPALTTKELIQNSSDFDVVFLATPTEASMTLVSDLTDTDLKIIDLSGAFRLPEAEFHQWYGVKHTAPHLIQQACYGLSPWVTSQPQHQLIANPGCYATCALMSLVPLLKANLVATDSIIIDAKSGASGAGKQAKADLMFCELSGNFIPYKIGAHQHTPEIKNSLLQLTGTKPQLRFATSLLPIVRGISMNIYLEAADSSWTDEELAAAIQSAFAIAYQDYSLVQYQEVGKQGGAEDAFILSLNNVVQTPFCHIGYFVKDAHITLFACIDNLLKGAASQAIENVNALYSLPVDTGFCMYKEEVS